MSKKSLLGLGAAIVAGGAALVYKAIKKGDYTDDVTTEDHIDAEFEDDETIEAEEVTE